MWLWSGGTVETVETVVGVCGAALLVFGSLSVLVGCGFCRKKKRTSAKQMTKKMKGQGESPKKSAPTGKTKAVKVVSPLPPMPKASRPRAVAGRPPTAEPTPTRVKAAAASKEQAVEPPTKRTRLTTVDTAELSETAASVYFDAGPTAEKSAYCIVKETSPNAPPVVESSTPAEVNDAETKPSPARIAATTQFPTADVAAKFPVSHEAFSTGADSDSSYMDGRPRMPLQRPDAARNQLTKTGSAQTKPATYCAAAVYERLPPLDLSPLRRPATSPRPAKELHHAPATSPRQPKAAEKRAGKLKAKNDARSESTASEHYAAVSPHKKRLATAVTGRPTLADAKNHATTEQVAAGYARLPALERPTQAAPATSPRPAMLVKLLQVAVSPSAAKKARKQQPAPMKMDEEEPIYEETRRVQSDMLQVAVSPSAAKKVRKQQPAPLKTDEEEPIYEEPRRVQSNMLKVAVSPARRSRKR